MVATWTEAAGPDQEPADFNSMLLSQEICSVRAHLSHRIAALFSCSELIDIAYLYVSARWPVLPPPTPQKPTTSTFGR